MAEMYNHHTVEKKWQKIWDDEKAFKTENDYTKPKFYALVEFPYPSGQGLHVGHPRPYTALDIVARKRRMQGYNVLYPMGWDAFGLPTENYAIKNKVHPKEVTKKNVARFKEQLHSLGYSFDWDREINTTDPDYYKWTQWIFLKLFNAGLAYKKEMPINWCTSCKVGLANEEVVNGVCERCGSPVVRKVKSEWMLKITNYADKLLEGLNDVDYIERVKTSQRNWIGRSEGAEVDFRIKDKEDKLRVYTTRPDTLFGATYMVVSPEHPIIDKYKDKIKNWDAIVEYREMASRKSDFERTELAKDKTGVVLDGLTAINPINDTEIPIWISDYVLMTYGTGAIMAVPAHDDRDYAFAKKFGIDIIPVLEGGDVTKEAWTQDGVHINSDFLNGLDKQEAIDKMLDWLEEHHCGSKHVNYRLREWIFARQRYWGEPIPIINFDDGTSVALSDDQLPLILPELEDYSPSKTGSSPLDKAVDWVNVEVDGKKGKRETSTMPGSAGSSWYFLRYIDPHNDKAIADPELLKHWMPVDLYVGGPEHAVGHLLYSRMWNNYLYDKGIVPVKEPFKKLYHQGMILGPNGVKMSKSKGNVINPDDIVEAYGADTLRLYEMFMGPLEASKPWSETGVEGSKKWLERVYRLFVESDKLTDTNDGSLDFVYHSTVKKVTEDYENLGFNTAISQMMIFINEAYKAKAVYKPYAEGIVKMLSCIAPHICEEMWEKLGYEGTIAYEAWPTYEEDKLVVSTIEIAVQVNGKVRGRLSINKDQEAESVKQQALELENVKAHTDGKEIKKIIYVPNKIVNIVVK